MLPSFLEFAQKTLDANKDVGMVYGGSMGIDSAGRIIGTMFHGGPFSREQLCKENFIDWSEAVFRRKAWEGHTLPKWVVYHLDWIVWLTISEKWHVINLTRPIIYYRVHPGSHSKTRRFEIKLEQKRILRDIIEGTS